MERVNTVEKEVAVETAVETLGKDEAKEFNALQDWMCSIGEPWSSVIVSIAVGIVIIIAMFVLDAVYWHSITPWQETIRGWK